MIFNTSFYGYSARHHQEGGTLARYLSLLIGSKIALWQVLITSGEFGFERETIEKATIDGLLIPTLDALSTSDRNDLRRLFDAAQSGEDDAWANIDEWVATLYGLRSRDLQVILDTLEFNLPFAKNRNRAQAQPSEQAVQDFCAVLNVELKPWAKRFGRAIEAKPARRLDASPWRTLCISSSDRSGLAADGASLNWHKFLPLADHFAATEVSFVDEAGCLCLGRLDQARYWSESQARQLAQRVAWEHMDVLKGRKTA